MENGFLSLENFLFCAKNRGRWCQKSNFHPTLWFLTKRGLVLKKIF